MTLGSALPDVTEGGTMQSEIMFAGFGGQGILLIGKVLAHAAMEEGLEVEVKLRL